MNEFKAYSGEFNPDLTPNSFSRELLVELMKLYSKLYLAIDGFWYLSVMNKVDEATATECDIWVWEKQARYEMKRIVSLLDIKDRDIAAFFKCLQFSPWVWNLEQKMEVKNKNLGIWTIMRCPTLEALEKEGKGRDKYFCKSVEIRIFGALASSFNPSIEFEYLKLPPKKSDNEPCCQWQFKIKHS